MPELSIKEINTMYAEILKLRADHRAVEEELAAVKAESKQKGEIAYGYQLTADDLTKRLRAVEEERDRLMGELDRLDMIISDYKEYLKFQTQQIATLTAEVAKLQADIQEMVNKAADQHLEGYRELGRKAADAENAKDRLTAEVKGLREALEATIADLMEWQRTFGTHSETMKIINQAQQSLAGEVKGLKEALEVEKTHSATSDFCASEWKSDTDEFRSLVKSAMSIISEELLEPYSREDQLRIKGWIEDAQQAIAGKVEA